MVDAFTFDNGSTKRFSSRKEMYDWMVDNGHIILEGDDAPKFEAHCQKRKDAKANEALARIQA